MKATAIVSDPDILGGTPVFRGTRVPIQALFDYLRFSSIDDFFKGYPHVSRTMVNDVLESVSKKIATNKRHYETVA
jgi:uncharacterized protein (DUF433 family)